MTSLLDLWDSISLESVSSEFTADGEEAVSHVPRQIRIHERYPKALTWWSTGYNPKYEYQTLPQEKAIRLFQLYRGSGSEIEGTLISLKSDRDDPIPGYIALSYTWGISERAPWETEESARFPIFIDGKEHLVVENLYHGLQALRELLNQGTFDIDYFWIDAICVNQTDLEERSNQVNRMDVIFSDANFAIVWTGHASSALRRRMKYLFAGCCSLVEDIEKESWLNECYEADYWVDRIDRRKRFAAAGLPPPSAQHWQSFAMFVERRVWSRVWVIQEMTLPKNVLFLCGTALLPGKHLAKAMLQLAVWNRYDYLEVDTAYFQESYCGLSMKNTLHIRDEMRSLQDTPTWVQNFEAFMQGSTSSEQDSRSGAMVLCMGLRRSNYHDATDIRDKVFALLGLTRRFGAIGPWMLADYNKSPSRVFIETAQYIISNTSWLGYLAMRVSYISEPTGSLPSYVPDIAGRLLIDLPVGIQKEVGLLNVLADRAPRRGRPEFQGDFLDVYGIPIGTVDAIAETNLSFCDGVSIFEDAAVLISSCDEWYKFTNQPRMEAVSRTIVEDDKLSSLKTMDSSFVSYWLSTISKIVWNNGQRSQSLEIFLSSHPEIHKVLKSFFLDEMTWQQLSRGLSAAIMNQVIPLTQNRLWNQLAKDAIPYHTSLLDFSFRRRFFKTERGHFGLSYSEDVQVGDSVWVLARAPCPFLLRKVNVAGAGNEEDGSGNRYTLVARAYVHGFGSGGNILENLGNDWQNIIIE